MDLVAQVKVRQLQAIKINIMTTQSNQITINIPDGYEIDTANSDLKTGKIAFISTKAKYPLSVAELPVYNSFYINNDGEIKRPLVIVNRNRTQKELNHLSTESRAKAFLALMQLVELKDAWNKVDGFVANWNTPTQYKFCIVRGSTKRDNNLLTVSAYEFSYHFLYFKDKKTANLFLNTFSELFEEAMGLIQ